MKHALRHSSVVACVQTPGAFIDDAAFAWPPCRPGWYVLPGFRPGRPRRHADGRRRIHGNAWRGENARTWRVPLLHGSGADMGARARRRRGMARQRQRGAQLDPMAQLDAGQPVRPPRRSPRELFRPGLPAIDQRAGGFRGQVQHRIQSALPDTDHPSGGGPARRRVDQPARTRPHLTCATRGALRAGHGRWQRDRAGAVAGRPLRRRGPPGLHDRRQQPHPRRQHQRHRAAGLDRPAARSPRARLVRRARRDRVSAIQHPCAGAAAQGR